MSINTIKKILPKLVAQKNQVEIDVLVKNAKKSTSEGNLCAAIKDYESAISLGCTAVGVYCALGRLFLRTGANQSAEGIAIQALLKKPNHIPSVRLLADALRNSFPADVVNKSYHGFFPSYIGEKYFSNSLDSVGIVDNPFIERHLAFPAETTLLFPPKKIHQDTHKEFFLRKAASPNRYVDVISGGSVWYDDFNIALFDGNQNRLNDHPVSIGYGPLLKHLASGQTPISIKGTAMLLGARGSCGFGHWMLDTLPALEAVRKCGIPLASIDKFIISGGDLGFKRATLERFGVAKDRIVDVKENPHVAAEKLIVADVVTNMARRMGTWLPEFLRKEFLLAESVNETSEGAHIAEDSPQRRVYVSRGGVGTRGVENEDEMVNFIETYGFERVTIETMTLQEQARMFSQCEVVLAPHGAALINLVHCKPGTKLIEFYNAHLEPCFWIMSRLSKLDYYHQFCGLDDQENGSNSADQQLAAVREGVNNSYTVDINELSNLFDYAGVSKQLKESK